MILQSNVIIDIWMIWLKSNNKPIFSPKMRQFVLVILIFFSGTAYGQEISLVGQVSIHNSLYNTGQIEFVSNVYVIAPFTNPDDTDELGRFTLSFVGLERGTQIELSVEKAGYEVVNAYDLQYSHYWTKATTSYLFS